MSSTAETGQQQNYSSEAPKSGEVVLSHGRVLLELGAPATRGAVWGNEVGVKQVHELMAEAVYKRSF